MSKSNTENINVQVIIGKQGYLQTPEWAPIEKLFRTAIPPVMYMGTVFCEGKRVHLYKHIDTRHYLNLDDEGQCYKYCGKASENEVTYMAIEQSAAIEHFNN